MQDEFAALVKTKLRKAQPAPVSKQELDVKVISTKKVLCQVSSKSTPSMNQEKEKAPPTAGVLYLHSFS